MFRRADEKDYYAILQVDPLAEPEVIEAAYRRLSRKYHPDVSGEADAGRRMRDLNEAYEVLGDPARRRAYDRRRPLGPRAGPAARSLTPQDLLRPLLPYLLAALALLGIRLIPLLLRPPVLIVFGVAVSAYVILSRFRRR